MKQEPTLNLCNEPAWETGEEILGTHFQIFHQMK